MVKCNGIKQWQHVTSSSATATEGKVDVSIYFESNCEYSPSKVIKRSA